MNLLNVLADSPIMDGHKEWGFVDSLLIAFVAILIVFGVLLVIIGLTHFLFKGINALTAKFQEKKKAKNDVKTIEETPKTPQKVEITDEDTMAAVLCATIDYQNEIKKDVRVVSVKEIK